VTSSEVLLERVPAQGWWLVVDEDGDERVVAGPFADRVEAGWAGVVLTTAGAHPVFGMRGADGAVRLCPSPEEWAWLAHLGDQLDRLPTGWDDELAEDDPLVTLVVEVAAVLCEAGLPLQASGDAVRETGGVCLSPEPALDAVVVTWRQHDRVDLVDGPGAETHALVRQVMDRAVGDVLLMRGFAVDTLPGGSGSVVRWSA
jgi:hypothetical protein